MIEYKIIDLPTWHSKDWPVDLKPLNHDNVEVKLREWHQRILNELADNNWKVKQVVGFRVYLEREI